MFRVGKILTRNCKNNSRSFMLETMNELEEVLIHDLEIAVERAKQTGQFDVADYLSLKNTNDTIRTESVKWLFETVLDIVFTFNRHGANIKIEQKPNHKFEFNRSNLSGELLKLRQGVRCLSIEAGWTRTPADGFMRGGALAAAKLSHFGFKKMNEDLALLEFDGTHQWFSIADERNRISFNVQSLKKHFEVFLEVNS